MPDDSLAQSPADAMLDPIQRIRRFHRAVTTEAGVLDQSFLGRGRPLGPARVLNAIGRGMTEIGTLRSYLGLDSGLMSRLLRGLEAEELVETGSADGDSRRRIARLTPQGQQEFQAYERLSDAQARDILSRHPRPGDLLAAMDLIASTLGRDRIVVERVPVADSRAQACLQAYYRELAQRLDQGFDPDLSCDPEARDMEQPRGAFLLALSDGMALGCVGIKGTEKGYGEIKRLWIAPSARGLGLAHRLMAAAEAEAAALGMTLLRLDTNRRLPEAVALYRKTGWTEIPRFNPDPYPDLFFEKAVVPSDSIQSHTICESPNPPLEPPTKP